MDSTIGTAPKRPIIPEPSRDLPLPSTFESKPIHITSTHVRVDELIEALNSQDWQGMYKILRNAPQAKLIRLIEDWPRRISGSSQDWQSVFKILQQRVTFSKSNSMQLYHLDQLYAQIKSYSKEDCRGFTSESLMEAAMIKKLVLSSTPPDASTKETLKYLLKNDVISSEEIRGIEHLIHCKSASKLLQRRRDHVRAIVSMQHRMKTLNIQYYLGETLASFSASMSSRSTKAARIYAAMADAPVSIGVAVAFKGNQGRAGSEFTGCTVGSDGTYEVEN